MAVIMPELLAPIKKRFPGFLTVFDKEAMNFFMKITSQIVEQRKHENFTVRKSKHFKTMFLRFHECQLI